MAAPRVTRPASAPRWTRATVLWIAVLALMASFQLWRGAFVDGILFLGLVLMLVVDRLTGGRIVLIRRAAKTKRSVIIGVAAVLAIAFVATPRHGLVDAVAMAITGTLALVLAWSPMGTRPPRPAVAYRRSAIAWSVLGVGLCLWEAGAYAASVSGGGDTFPTISVLIDPLLNNVVGLVVFSGLWFAAGLSLLNVWSRR